MTKNNASSVTEKDHGKEVSLKGTLIFTMFVGFFIVASWLAIFFLFFNRM